VELLFGRVPMILEALRNSPLAFRFELHFVESVSSAFFVVPATPEKRRKPTLMGRLAAKRKTK
jgi:hypothetical protein